MKTYKLTGDPELDEIKEHHNLWVEHKEKAKTRCSESDEIGWWFGIVGLEHKVRSFNFGNGMEIRPIEEPPWVSDLGSAMEFAYLSGAVARYIPFMTHELHVKVAKDKKDLEEAFRRGCRLLALIRIKTNIPVLAPFYSDRAWATIAAFDDGEVSVLPIEEYPHAFNVKKTYTLSDCDLSWVRDHFEGFIRLLNSPKFMIAADALSSHTHEATVRMQIATLWSGIEALFGINQELRYRLSLSIATLLTPRGQTRIDCYRRLKKAYDLRSKAVHGSKISDDDMRDHVAEIKEILSGLILYSISSENLIDQQLIEAKLLG